MDAAACLWLRETPLKNMNPEASNWICTYTCMHFNKKITRLQRSFYLDNTFKSCKEIYLDKNL